MQHSVMLGEFFESRRLMRLTLVEVSLLVVDHSLNPLILDGLDLTINVVLSFVYEAYKNVGVDGVDDELTSASGEDHVATKYSLVFAFEANVVTKFGLT